MPCISIDATCNRRQDATPNEDDRNMGTYRHGRLLEELQGKLFDKDCVRAIHNDVRSRKCINYILAGLHNSVNMHPHDEMSFVKILDMVLQGSHPQTILCCQLPTRLHRFSVM